MKYKHSGHLGGGSDSWRWTYFKRDKDSDPKPEASRQRSPGLDKLQVVSKRDCILARLEWPVGEAGSGLSTMAKVLTIKAQANTQHVFRPRNTCFLWTKLATDLFHFEGDSYLLIVDYTSRYPVICKLTKMTAQNVIGHLKVIFSEYGWPDNIVSDNGPCYTAEAFTKTMQEYQVNHITSSPHYPQSNGLAEKFVQQWKAYSIRSEKKVWTCIRPWKSITTHHLQATCNLWCRSYKTELLDCNYQCLIVLGDSLV